MTGAKFINGSTREFSGGRPWHKKNISKDNEKYNEYVKTTSILKICVCAQPGKTNFTQEKYSQIKELKFDMEELKIQQKEVTTHGNMAII